MERKEVEKKTKEIAIISGKGGTGKTVITGALSSLVENKVICDCDVDAANLHFLLKPEIKETRDFIGGEIARIDEDKCTQCMKCVEVCRWDAIAGEPLIVLEQFCEGCAACIYVCPVDAIVMNENKSGELFISESRVGPMVHARLGIAEDNSGKLVSEVRKEALIIAEEKGLDTIIIDGPPGIGCPVIASITGVNLAIVVTEPTVSGAHDLVRVLELTAKFRLPTVVIVNKFDINRDITESIKDESKKYGSKVVGVVSYHEGVIDSIREAKTIIEAGPPELKVEITNIWEIIKKEHLNDR
jgi:MinD superfamily P-loop ATPase